MAHTKLSTSKELVSVSNVANNDTQMQDTNPPPKSPSPSIGLRPMRKVRNYGMKLTEDLSVNADLISSRSLRGSLRADPPSPTR